MTDIDFVFVIFQMPYLQLTDAGSITVQKDVKGAITHTNKGVVRRMFVVNEPFTQASSQRYCSIKIMQKTLNFD